MGSLIPFPSTFGNVLASGPPYEVEVRLTSRTAWRHVYAQVLHFNMCAAGFSANAGFRRTQVRTGVWHCFSIRRRKLARRYLRYTCELRNAGLIDVMIDGVPVPSVVGRRRAAA
jgi:hypothetical protein